MVPFTVALLTTLVTAPLIRAHLVRRGLMDIPNHRSSHTVPVPRGGGIACLVGILAGTIAAAVRGDDTPWGAVTAALILGAVGLLDDRIGLRAVPRLFAQALSGVVAGGLIALGLGVGGLWTLGIAAAGAVAMVLSVNVVNFMDGINGITALTLSVWGGTMAWVGSTYGLHEVRIAGLLALAAALGFLPFNAPIARLFLGDAGSYGFGGLVGVTSLYAVAHAVPWFLVFAPVTPYLVDVLVTLARRAAAHRPLLDAHREHLYQRLTDLPGISHTSVAALFACAAAVTVIIARLTGSGTMVGVTAAAGVLAVLAPGRLTHPR